MHGTLPLALCGCSGSCAPILCLLLVCVPLTGWSTTVNTVGKERFRNMSHLRLSGFHSLHRRTVMGTTLCLGTTWSGLHPTLSCCSCEVGRCRTGPSRRPSNILLFPLALHKDFRRMSGEKYYVQYLESSRTALPKITTLAQSFSLQLNE